MDFATRFEERAEEAKALQVVEVEMAEQHVDPRSAIAAHGYSERTHTRARVEYKQLAVVSTHLHARGIAAISERVGAWRGQRPAATPHADPHSFARQNTVSTPCISPTWPKRGYAVTSNGWRDPSRVVAKSVRWAGSRS